MNVLVVTPRCHKLHPGGAQEDMYACARLLTLLGHDVVFATLDSPPHGTDILEWIGKKTGTKVVGLASKGEGLLSWLWSGIRDFALFQRTAWEAELAVRTSAWSQLFDEHHFDLVVSFCSYTWPVLQAAKRRGARTVFRSHDFEPRFFWEGLSFLQRLNPRNWLRFFTKWLGELRAVHFADCIAPTPLQEVTELYERWKSGRSVVITLAYLPEWLRKPQVNLHKRPLDVFYMGASYTVAFHLRGARMLIDEIAPQLEREAPGAFRINICGEKLPVSLRARCGVSVVYRDYVPDIREFLRGMDIGIAPVDTGKSIKGKVFAPLCAGFPMIVAPNCLSGYPLRDGEEVFIASNPEGYVRALRMLLNDDVRASMANEAYNFSLERFSEAKLLADMNAAIQVALR